MSINKLPQSQKSQYCCCVSFMCCCYKVKKNTQKGKTKWSQFFRITRNQIEDSQNREIFQILLDLYDSKDIISKLAECRANPDFSPDNPIRNDLEYYIPQLTNFMIFHEEVINQELMNFMLEVSKTDFYFGHRYYWYLNSLIFDESQQNEKEILQTLEIECARNEESNIFLASYTKFRNKQSKLSLSLNEHSPTEKQEADYRKNQVLNQAKNIVELGMTDYKSAISTRHKIEDIIKKYKADDLNTPTAPDIRIKASDIQLNNYVKIFPKGDGPSNNHIGSQEPIADTTSDGFTSTLNFFDDLRRCCEKIAHAADKLTLMKQYLNEMNKSLPACVYVPFIRDYLRNSAILNIVTDETKVFSTKDRAPCYICLELFRPEEELESELSEAREHHESIHKTNIKELISAVTKKFRPQTISKDDSKINYSPLKIKNIITERISRPIFIKHGATLNEEKLESFNQSSLKFFKSNTKSFGLDNKNIVEANEKAEEEESKLFISTKKSKIQDPDNFGISIIYTENRTKRADSDGISKPLANRLVDSVVHVEENITHNSNVGTINEPLLENHPIEENEDYSQTKDIDKTISECNDSMISVIDSFFGEDSIQQRNRIKEISPFSNLKSWRLSHLIIKIGADLKEEQFAIQLISQFDQVFRKEKSKLMLTPYEIISLGPDFGLVEMIKDATTISRIKELCYKKNLPTLNKFFIDQFPKEKLNTARENFARSLAAYSLVCYLLQIKDRHNGNILLKNDGSIIHIDFGFFLSNAPGGALEQKVPFKLTNEDIDVLEGNRSKLFMKFRKYFAKGFQIARKHRNEILILVKMMYSAHGENLPCFRRGKAAIEELEQRFSPPKINLNSEHDVYSYCQSLINQSLDNWRAKCYDKYQYYVQGIFY